MSTFVDRQEKRVSSWNDYMERQTKMMTFITINALNGKIKSDVRKTGDETEVTCLLKIRGCEFVGKVTASGSKFENFQEVNAMKREACILAFDKWVEDNKDSIDGMSKDDLDRFVDSLYA